jgi:precorrin-6A/cobalt-precorrin-6A reductase
MHQASPRLWLIGGTGEGPELAERLLQRGWQLTVSLVSAPAALAYRPHPGLTLRVGAIDGEQGVGAELAAAEAEGWPYAVVVDASHPFACLVSRQLAAACAQRGQRLIRLLRPPLTGAATILPSLEDLRSQSLQGQSLLLAIGARQLNVALACSPGAHHYARLLPSPTALQQAMAAGLAADQVACLRPGSGLEVERALLRRWRITTVLARQSGGPTELLWRQLCATPGPHLLLIGRPAEPAGVEALSQADLLGALVLPQ